MTTYDRLAVVNAVLLGVLLVGTCLPFDQDAPTTLWGDHSESGAGGARMAVIILVIVLLGSIVAGVGLATGLLEVGAGVLSVVAVADFAEGTEEASGSGGSLLMVTIVLTVVVGLTCAAKDLLERRSA